MGTIRVLYFANLRERLGKSREVVEAEGIQCAADVWRRVSAFPPSANVLIAINQEYASMDSPVRAGDEVAFFPPVTGG